MVDLAIPVRLPGSVEAVVDGQRVLLSPKDLSYFAVEGSGARVWDLIDGCRSSDEIVAELVAQFEAPEGAIRVDTVSFLSELVELGLITSVESPDARARD